MPDLPRGAKRAAAYALQETRNEWDDEWSAAEVALRAALPIITRDVQRQMARRLLMMAIPLDFSDACYAWRSALRKAGRTGLLPDLPAGDDNA